MMERIVQGEALQSTDTLMLRQGRLLPGTNLATRCCLPFGPLGYDVCTPPEGSDESSRQEVNYVNYCRRSLFWGLTLNKPFDARRLICSKIKIKVMLAQVSTEPVHLNIGVSTSTHQPRHLTTQAHSPRIWHFSLSTGGVFKAFAAPRSLVSHLQWD
jgi:hypothetical protein